MNEFGYDWTDAEAVKSEEAVVAKIKTKTPFQYDLDTLKLHARHEMGAEGVAFLAKMLEQNTTLTKLSLMNDNIGDTGAESLAALLLVNTTIQTLVLTNNKIGCDGAIALSKALGGSGKEKGNATLTTLYCGGNQFGDKGAKALCKSLQRNTTLTAFSVSWNKMTSSGLKYLTKLVAKNASITSLYMGSNQFAEDKDALNAFVSAISKNVTLKQLSMLGIMKAGNPCESCLAKIPLKNNTIEELNLSDNNLSSAAVKEILASVCTNTGITNLNLSGNAIDGSLLSDDFTNLLKSNKKLLVFNVGDNHQLGTQGAEGIWEGLKVNTSLTALYMFGSDIGDKCITSMCNALKENTTLNYVNMRHSEITCAGFEELLAFVQDEQWREVSGLATLDLAGNRGTFSPEGKELCVKIQSQLTENVRVRNWKGGAPFRMFVLRQILSRPECLDLMVPTEILYYILLLTMDRRECR